MPGPIGTHPTPTSFRPVGGTENGWCKAVQTGTGTVVLAVLLNKTVDSSLLHSAIHALLSSHPMIRSKLHYDTKSNSFSIVTPCAASLPDVAVFDVHSTSEILQRSTHSGTGGSLLSGFHVVLQHELNRNPWKYPDRLRDSEVDVFHATLYALSEKQCALALRLHVAAFDRVGAASLFRTLVQTLAGGEAVAVGVESVSPAIEDLLPRRKGKKALWARGVNLLGYSLSSLRMENLDFVDARSDRSSEVVRFQMNLADTHRLITVSGRPAH